MADTEPRSASQAEIQRSRVDVCLTGADLQIDLGNDDAAESQGEECKGSEKPKNLESGHDGQSGRRARMMVESEADGNVPRGCATRAVGPNPQYRASHAHGCCLLCEDYAGGEQLYPEEGLIRQKPDCGCLSRARPETEKAGGPAFYPGASCRQRGLNLVGP